MSIFGGLEGQFVGFPSQNEIRWQRDVDRLRSQPEVDRFITGSTLTWPHKQTITVYLFIKTTNNHR